MHVTYILSICSQRIFLLKRLRDQGLPVHYLDLVFHAIVVSRILYAFLYGDHVCLLNKSIELILSSKDHIAVALLSKVMTLLFWLITPVRICLVKQCPIVSPTSLSTHHSTTTDWEKHDLRTRGHNYPLPQCKYNLHRNSFLVRSLFEYVKLFLFIVSLLQWSMWTVHMHVWCIFYKTI